MSYSLDLRKKSNWLCREWRKHNQSRRSI